MIKRELTDKEKQDHELCLKYLIKQRDFIDSLKALKLQVGTFEFDNWTISIQARGEQQERIHAGGTWYDNYRSIWSSDVIVGDPQIVFLKTKEERTEELKNRKSEKQVYWSLYEYTGDDELILQMRDCFLAGIKKYEEKLNNKLDV